MAARRSWGFPDACTRTDGLHHGFTLVQVLAEFRALRASVLRLYELSGEADLAGVRRFNEAIDEALTESVTRYSAQTDLYRDQFVGILSHDLRSPLGAITAGAALLAHAAADDQRQARVAARILNSAQRMARMIADLLDLTRTRLGGVIPLKAVRTDLQSVCEEVVLEVQASHPDAVVHFESRGDVTGQWDADRLAQVVSNLVGNAIEHGGKTPVTVVASEARRSREAHRPQRRRPDSAARTGQHLRAARSRNLGRHTQHWLGLVYRTCHRRRSWRRDPSELNRAIRNHVRTHAAA